MITFIELRDETAKMHMPFHSNAKAFSRYESHIADSIDVIVHSGEFTNGQMVSELEQALTKYTGASHVIGVSNGSDALILMMTGLGIGPGDDVIVPCFTFISSATSVLHVGATPVFVDVEPKSYGMDVKDFESKIGTKTRAVMPVHLFQQPANLPTIMDIAEKHNLLVLEDSAEGIGMRVSGQHVGTFGAAGNLSFFPSKTLGCFGDAGAVLTNDERLAERVRLLRNQGRKDNNSQSLIAGLNARMDELQAAVLLARLRHLDHEILEREQLHRRYNERLSQLAPNVEIPVSVLRDFSVQSVVYVYLIEATHRDELARYVQANGIPTEVYYPMPIPSQPCFRAHVRPESFPVAERACERTLALPLFSGMRMHEVDLVCKAVESFYMEESR